MRELSLSASDPKTLAKQRNKEIVAKCLHKIGIVVLYDEQTDVGYRSLPMTDSRPTQLTGCTCINLFIPVMLQECCMYDVIMPSPSPSLSLHRGADEAAQ